MANIFDAIFGHAPEPSSSAPGPAENAVAGREGLREGHRDERNAGRQHRMQVLRASHFHFKSNHHSMHVGIKTPAVQKKKREQQIDFARSGESMDHDRSAKALAYAAQKTGVNPKFLETLAGVESGFGGPRGDFDGRDRHGHIVSRGLTMQTIPTFLSTLRNHKAQMNDFFGDHPGIAPAAERYVNGDHSQALTRSIEKGKADTDLIKEMYSPEVSAYVCALEVKDNPLSKNHPGLAYLGYVNPKLAGVIEADGRSHDTKGATPISTLAATHGIETDVYRNNPGIYGPDGSWSANEVIAKIDARFKGAEPAAHKPHGPKKEKMHRHRWPHHHGE